MGLPHQHLQVVIGGIDERLEQVNERNVDDGSGQLHFQYGRIYVIQPFWLVGVVVKIHSAHKRLVPTNDHHDQQFGDDDHINDVPAPPA